MKRESALAVFFFCCSLIFGQTFQFDENFFNELKAGDPKEALILLKELEPKEAIVYADRLSDHWRDRGNYTAAESLLRYAIDTAAAHNLSSDTAFFYYKLSILYNSLRKVEEAMEAMQKAAAMYRELGEEEWYLQSLLGLASLQHTYGFLKESLANYEEIIRELADGRNKLLLAHVLYEAAMVRYKIGYRDGIVEKLDMALKLFEEKNHLSGMGSVYKAYGNYYASLGDQERALSSYHKAREYFLASNNAHEYANTSYNIGLIKLGQEEYGEAISYFQNAISNFTIAGSNSGAGMAGTALARTYFELKKTELALSTLGLAVIQLKHSKSNRRLALAEELFGEIFYSVSDLEKAMEHYQSALDIYNSLHLQNQVERIKALLQKLKSEKDKLKPEAT